MIVVLGISSHHESSWISIIALDWAIDWLSIIRSVLWGSCEIDSWLSCLASRIQRWQLKISLWWILKAISIWTLDIILSTSFSKCWVLTDHMSLLVIISHLFVKCVLLNQILHGLAPCSHTFIVYSLTSRSPCHSVLSALLIHFCVISFTSLNFISHSIPHSEIKLF